jgi:DNA-binding NarL/FixJ family response regulator
VYEAKQKRTGWRFFACLVPDVTLMDLEMPSLNGIEAINQIRGEFPEARIIILTTYIGDAKVVRALKAGARTYVLPIRALVFLRQ